MILGLGIGVVTSVFSLINVLLIRPLAYPQADRLVQFRLDYETGSQFMASDRHFAHWSRAREPFDSLTAYLGPIGTHIEGEHEPLSVRGLQVSPEYFETFGIQLSLGPGFTEEVTTEVPTQVVLSRGLWDTAFGGELSIIGDTIQLDGHGLMVVGVSTAGASPFDADLWTPLHLEESPRGYLLRVTGRLRRGVHIERAAATMAAAQASFEPGTGEEQGTLSLHPFQVYLFGDRRPTLLLLLAGAVVVFLLACANVANLQLSAVASRGREVAVRAALGASFLRGLRPLMLESTLVALVGAGLGIGLAAAASRWVTASGVAVLADAPEVRTDLRVLACAVGAGLTATLIAWLAPVLQTRRLDIREGLRRPSLLTGNRAAGRMIRQILIGAEIALTLLAVLTATLLVRSYGKLAVVDPGFQGENVVAVELPLSAGGYATAGDLSALHFDLLPSLESLPSVVAAAATTALPIEASDYLRYTVEGVYVQGSQDGQGLAQYRGITPGYLQALGIPLQLGRAFRETDLTGAPLVALINERAAEKQWPGQNPIGQRIRIFPGTIYEEPPRTVVGVVGDVAEVGLGETYRWESLYVPLGQMPDAIAKQVLRHPVSLVVKSDTDLSSVLPAVRERIRAFDGKQPLGRARAMEEVVAGSLSVHGFRATIVTGLAVLALLLAAVGVYGVFSVLTSARSRELAVRVALGSSPRQLAQLLLRQGLWPVLIGVAVGLTGALAAGRVVGSQIYGISASDPGSLLSTIVVLLATAAAAMMGPALRALRTDPAPVLRQE